MASICDILKEKLDEEIAKDIPKNLDKQFWEIVEERFPHYSVKWYHAHHYEMGRRYVITNKDSKESFEDTISDYELFGNDYRNKTQVLIRCFKFIEKMIEEYEND